MQCSAIEQSVHCRAQCCIVGYNIREKVIRSFKKVVGNERCLPFPGLCLLVVIAKEDLIKFSVAPTKLIF